jgi:hypothetical protein
MDIASVERITTDSRHALIVLWMYDAGAATIWQLYGIV